MSTSFRFSDAVSRAVESSSSVPSGEEEVDGASPIRRMLADLSKEERLVQLALAPLSVEHTRVLVRSLAEGSTADESSLEDRQGAWPHHPAVAAAPSRPRPPVSRRRSRPSRKEPEQLILPPAPATPKAKARAIPAPEQAARVYITRRSKPSVGPGHVKPTFMLDMRREWAERLSARAIRDGVNLEGVVIEFLGVSVANER